MNAGETGTSTDVSAAGEADENVAGETDDDGVRDLLGVGLGPFNLGLAALVDGADGLDLDALFLEQRSSFAWHPGMLLSGTTLEVPFLADLVSLADPTNEYSYLNYLRERDRLYEFYFYETFQTPRREYDDYCRWTAESIPDCRFERRVTDVTGGVDGPFEVTAENPETGETHAYRARDLVVGVGSRPFVPEGFRGHPDGDVFHTASYLDRREGVLDADGITVVGSGQSAAEAFLDLLERQPDRGYRLDWLTRSDGFFPMEYSKLGLQHFTPEYTRHFADLPASTREELLAEQDLLYKGIDPDTSEAIYDALYEQSVGDRDPDVGMLAATEVTGVAATDGGRYRLRCVHSDEGTRFDHETDAVVVGTGYHRPTPEFLGSVEGHVRRDDRDRLRVGEGYELATEGLSGRIFVQNAPLHSHGVGTPDLGLGAYRNSVVLDRLVADSPYPVDRDTVFQDFDPERFVERSPASDLVRSAPTPPSDD